MTAAVDRWPLVGRGELVERFADLIETPSGGLLIIGPPGVGKTRLAQECAAGAERSGRRVLRAVASRAAAQLPLGALAHLLPADVGRSGVDPAQLFDGVQAHLSDPDDPLRPLLVVDDLHLLDAASLVLVAQLLVVGLVVVLATVRSGEEIPDTVTALWRDQRMERVDLDQLDRMDVDTLLHLALGGPIERAAASALWDRSDGNVLFLHELVVGAREQGTLVEREGVWGLAGPLTSSRRLAELVEDRLAGIDGPARAVLELLAWCQPVGLSELEDLTGLATLEALERSALVGTAPDGRRHAVQLSHPMYGEVLRSTTPVARRRALLRDQIERLRRRGLRRREDPLRVASWSLDGGHSPDPELLVRAARVARAAPDFAGVVRLARAARTAGLEGAVAAEAALLLGEALHETGEFDEAEQVLGAGLDLDPAEDLRLRLTVTRTKNLHWGLADADGALRVTREALAWPGWSSDARAELVADEASALVFSGHPAEAIAKVESVSSTDRRVRVVLAIPAAPALSALGRTAEAIERAERAFSEHTEMGDELAIASPGTHVVAQVFALTDAGRLVEAESLARVGYDMAVDADVPIATDLVRGEPRSPVDRAGPGHDRVQLVSRGGQQGGVRGLPRARANGPERGRLRARAGRRRDRRARGARAPLGPPAVRVPAGGGGTGRRVDGGGGRRSAGRAGPAAGGSRAGGVDQARLVRGVAAPRRAPPR